MLYIVLIRLEPDEVRRLLERPVDAVDLDGVLEADRRRRTVAQAIEAKRSDRNRIAKEIGKGRASGQDTSEVEREAAALRDEIATLEPELEDRKSTRLNSSHANISYAAFCL